MRCCPYDLSEKKATKSFADLAATSTLMDILALHRNLAYLIIFLGAFSETLIPLFFIYGEIFFSPAQSWPAPGHATIGSLRRFYIPELYSSIMRANGLAD